VFNLKLIVKIYPLELPTAKCYADPLFFRSAMWSFWFKHAHTPISAS